MYKHSETGVVGVACENERNELQTRWCPCAGNSISDELCICHCHSGVERIYTIKEVESYKKKPLTLLCKDISQVPCRRAPRAGSESAGSESAGRGAKRRRAESSRKILRKGCLKRDVLFCQNA